MSKSVASATLRGLAIPLLLNSMLGMITTVMDTVIISAHSKEAAAAVSLANQILMAAYDLSVLLAVGVTILIAHSLGRGNPERARSLVVIAVSANTLFGVVIGFFLYTTKSLLVDFVNAPQEISTDVETYIGVIAFAIPFNGFLMAGIASLRGFSQTRAIFLLGIIAFPSYLLLNYVLVLGFGPIPSLGVKGSALATLLLRIGSVCALVFVLRHMLSVRWRVPCSLNRVRCLLRRLTALSLPSVLDNVAYGFYQLVLVSFIAGFGVVAVVSRFYTLAVSAFLPVVIMAISQANEVLVGYRHGAGRTSEIESLAWRSGFLSVLLSTVLAVLVYIFSDSLLSMFSDDASVHVLAKSLLFLTIFIQPLSGLNTVLFHSLRVLGDVRAPVIFSQFVMWLIAVPIAYWLCVIQQYGVVGLWYAMIVEEFIKTIYMIYRWKISVHQDGAKILAKHH